ncbi:MAG: hypothetical protein HYV54_01710 [Parcubacteria group bacterium]|nr:hypothetical protein [Parcubacteria group bacterium]
MRAQIKAIGGYSAHADQAKLLEWVGHIKGVKNVFTVQGEAEISLALALKIRDTFNIHAEVPQAGNVIEL